MGNMVFLVASVAIAAFIGYVTNFLAIKMLFHPRTARKIRGRRVPFTPGLIPKRRGEIAVALGKVVSEYLVTADGIRDMLLRPEVRGQVEQKLRQLIEDWAARGETLEEIAARLIGAEATDDAKRTLEELLKQLIKSEVTRLWTTAPAGAKGVERVEAQPSNIAELYGDGDGEASGHTPDISGAELHHVTDEGQHTPDSRSVLHRPLSDVFDKLQIPVRQLVEREGASRVMSALREELSSASGMRLVHNIVTKILDGLGGMMGMFAGMFLDEDKIAVKVRSGILSYLNTPGAHEAIAGVLSKQLDQLVMKTPAELLSGLREQLEPHVEEEEERLSDGEWFAALAGRMLPVGAWLDRFWGLTPREILDGRTEWLIEQAPSITHRLVATAADHIEQAMRAINLPRLVQEQVENFPMEQVEQVILSITGREFKAITWLGAFLGGLIGIVQALLYIWLGS